MERRLTRVEGSSALSVAGSAEAEFAKDIWDVRNIPGAQYPDCNSRHLLRFTEVPLLYRSAVQHYLRTLILSAKSLALCSLSLLTTRAFLTFFVARYPQSRDLRDLAANDIEAYLGHLMMTPCRDGTMRSPASSTRYLQGLRLFLRYLQRTGNPLAPTRPLEQVAQGGQDLGCVPCAQTGAILAEGDIAHIVALVLDPPRALRPGKKPSTEAARICRMYH